MKKLLALFVLRLIYQQFRGRMGRSTNPGNWGGIKKGPIGRF